MLVPKLRFKEFNDEWNSNYKLSNIVTEFNEGNTKDTSDTTPLWKRSIHLVR